MKGERMFQLSMQGITASGRLSAIDGDIARGDKEGRVLGGILEASQSSGSCKAWVFFGHDEVV
jgi:hypothetical protein